jgi:hypothetical protein
MEVKIVKVMWALLATLILAVVMSLALAEEMAIPSVEVMDQSVVNGTVTVARVVSDGPGWMVIHADMEGKPGAVLGFAPVLDGENMEVLVNIDSTNATPVLHAMLHVDAGNIEVYEFPGADVPVTADGKVLMQAFNVTR